MIKAINDIISNLLLDALSSKIAILAVPPFLAGLQWAYRNMVWREWFRNHSGLFGINPYVQGIVWYATRWLFAHFGTIIWSIAVAFAYSAIPSGMSIASLIIIFLACALSIYQIRKSSELIPKKLRAERESLRSFLAQVEGTRGGNDASIDNYGILDLFREAYYERKELELAEWERQQSGY